MKTFQQFQQDLHEFVPALAAAAELAAPYVLPAAAAALGAAGMYFAKKQGQGGRSQPVDYGQSGEGSKPRTQATVRPAGPKADYKARLRAQQQARREEVQANREERAKQGIEQLLGTDAERAEAARARANPEAQRAAALRRTVSDRMRQAADKLGLPEQMTAPKLQGVGLDLRTTKEKQQEIDIPAKLLPFNPKIGDQYKTSQLDPGKSYEIGRAHV